MQGFWGSLPPAARAALLALATQSTFAAGRMVLAQEDSSGDVLVIWSGLVKVVARAANGRHVVLALRGAGDIVGELANINGGPRSAAVVALSRVEALVVPGAQFTRFLESCQVAAESVRRTIIDRLCETDRDRLAAATMTVGQRLARLLLKISARYGVPTPGGGRRTEQLSQHELAACIGGATRTVAREISIWRRRNIISTERRAIIVRQSSALERIVGRHAPPP